MRVVCNLRDLVVRFICICYLKDVCISELSEQFVGLLELRWSDCCCNLFSEVVYI